MATITRLKSLAGVRILDTPLAKATVDLLEVTSPQFICNHCVRTYVFGNLAVRSIGRSMASYSPWLGAYNALGRRIHRTA
jgi:hypothetical protein